MLDVSLTDDGHDALRGGGLEHGRVARDLAAEGARRREVHVVQHQLALRREVRLREEKDVLTTPGKSLVKLR